jgi:hypothetical protein
MPETHFRSMEAWQNKSDVTNRFGDRDFILAVCTCFIRKCDRFEVIRDFPSLIMAEFHFRSMEAPQNKSDVTIKFLIGGLVIHYAGIFHLSCSVQKLFKSFMLVQWLNIFFNLGGGANMTLKFSLQISTPQKALP